MMTFWGNTSSALPQASILTGKTTGVNANFMTLSKSLLNRTDTARHLYMQILGTSKQQGRTYFSDAEKKIFFWATQTPHKLWILPAWKTYSMSCRASRWNFCKETCFWWMSVATFSRLLIYWQPWRRVKVNPHWRPNSWHVWACLKIFDFLRAVAGENLSICEFTVSHSKEMLYKHF